MHSILFLKIMRESQKKDSLHADCNLLPLRERGWKPNGEKMNMAQWCILSHIAEVKGNAKEQMFTNELPVFTQILCAPKS